MKRFDTDVLIIGAGPAGMSAALAVAREGGKVLLVDDNPAPGGQIWRDGPQAHLPAVARAMRDNLGADNAIEILVEARVVIRHASQAVLLEIPDGAVVAYYRQLILCAGAREKLLPFPGWTLPGVTGVGGLQALIKAGFNAKGKRVVLAGSGPLLLASAASVKRAGGNVLAIVEQASPGALIRFAAGLWQYPSKLAQALKLLDRHYRPRAWVSRATGDDCLRSLSIHHANGKEVTLDCDWLGCGYGLVPNTELAGLFGCALEPDALLPDEAIGVNAFQQTSQASIYAAGECTGAGGSELARVEGHIAGLAALGISPPDKLLNTRAHWQKFARMLARTFTLDDALRYLVKEETLICRCEDVPHRLLHSQQNPVAAKMATRCGMGACQGQICSTATSFLYGWSRTSIRPPIFPAQIGTLIDSDKINE